MKKRKRDLIKGINWALAGLMSLLGFAGCIGIGEPMVLEYGVPWRSYAIKGAVKDKITGKPIEGIEVKIAVPDPLKRYFTKEQLEAWKTQTDKNGMFNLSDTPGDFMEYTPVAALDVDNEKNGHYRPDTLYVDYTNAEHIGDGKGWLQGELTSTIQFELEEDKDE